MTRRSRQRAKARAFAEGWRILMLRAYPDSDVPTNEELMKRGFAGAPPAPAGVRFHHVPTVEELTDILLGLSAAERLKYYLDPGIKAEVNRLSYAKWFRE